MHTLNRYYLVVLCLSVLAGAGCEKESTGAGVSFVPTPLPNTAPKVNAGQDIWVKVPVDSCILTGSAKDAEDNIEKYHWRQISRPQLSHLGSPDLAQTKV